MTDRSPNSIPNKNETDQQIDWLLGHGKAVEIILNGLGVSWSIEGTATKPDSELRFFNSLGNRDADFRSATFKRHYVEWRPATLVELTALTLATRMELPAEHPLIFEIDSYLAERLQQHRDMVESVSSRLAICHSEVVL